MSHQILGDVLGFPVVRLDRPNQGVARRIRWFGQDVTVGFYNSYTVRSRAPEVNVDGVGTVSVCFDPHTGEVHGLRAPGFCSVQFHPESVLSVQGISVLRRMVADVLRAPTPVAGL